MDENAKNEMRNYLSAAGFFVFAVSTLAIGVSYLSGTVGAEQKNITIISTLLLLLVGVLLAVIGKRDLTAITFLMLGSIKLLMLATGFVSPGINIILYLFLLILAVILLTAKDKAKYPLAILIALQALFTTVSYIIPSEEIMSSVFGYTRLILTVIALYYAFACASERICFPCSKILTADQETDFKKSASALGYLTISASMLVWAIYYLFNKSEIVANTIYALDGVYAALLILVSILLFAVAKMRFTPVMFLLAGSLLAVSSVIGATSEFIL